MTFLQRFYSGRLNREEFALASFLSIVMFIFAGIVLLNIYVLSPALISAFTTSKLYFVFCLLPAYLPYYLVVFSLNARRLHDIGLSGWFALLFTLPDILLNYHSQFHPSQRMPPPSGFYSLMAAFLLFMPGSKKPNQFGRPPAPGIDVRKILAIVHKK